MNKVLAVLMCTLFSGGPAMAQNCAAPDANSAEFAKAIRLVDGLPEKNTCPDVVAFVSCGI